MPLSGLPSHKEHMMLSTVACTVWTWFALLQKQPVGMTRTVNCYSHEATDPERLYGTMPRKCFTIFLSVLLVGLNIEVYWFPFCIDHDSMKQILNMSNFTELQPSWHFYLSKPESKVILCAAIEKKAANAHSQFVITFKDERLLKFYFLLFSNESRTLKNVPRRYPMYILWRQRTGFMRQKCMTYEQFLSYYTHTSYFYWKQTDRVL